MSIKEALKQEIVEAQDRLNEADPTSQEYANALKDIEELVKILSNFESREIAEAKADADLDRQAKVEERVERESVWAHEDKAEDRKLAYARLDAETSKAERDDELERARLDFERERLEFERESLAVEKERIAASKKSSIWDTVGRVVPALLTGGGAVAAAVVAANAKKYAVDEVIAYEDGKSERTHPQKVTSSASKFI